MKNIKLIILLAFSMIVPGAIAHEDCEESCRDDHAEYPSTVTDENDVPEGWRARFEQVTQMRNEMNDQLVSRLEMCRVRVEVKVVFFGDPHIYVTNPRNRMADRFIIVGPKSGVTGDYIVIPILTGSSWAHSWEQGPKVATEITGLADTYLVSNVVVSPHASPDTHLYQMEITEWARDDCPQKIEFKHLSHGSGPIYDHPGHAGAERG